MNQKSIALAPPRWRLLQDDDGHHYLVPADKEREFDAWERAVYDEEADPEGFEEFGAIRLNGSPSRITFVDPKEE